MKPKALRTKSLIALALALFMVVPMLFAAAPMAKALTQNLGPATISVVPTGGAGGTAGAYNNIAAQAVGTQFTVDVRIDNYANIVAFTDPSEPAGIDGASYNVNWNPAVLQYVSYTDGSWLPGQNSAGDLQTKVSTGQITFGQVAFSTSNPYAVATSATGSVSGQITFKVLTTGSSFITLSQTSPTVQYLAVPESVGGVVSGHGFTGTLTSNAWYNPQTTVSLVQAVTGASSFTVTGNPIGQTFQVNMVLNNPLQTGVWAWNLGVTWNAAVVQLTGVTEGSYLGGTSGSGSPTIFVPGYIDNTNGEIPQ
jgi:hypothetical protein